MVPVVDLVLRHPVRGEPTTPATFTGFPSWTRGDDIENEPESEGNQLRHMNGRRRARERHIGLRSDGDDNTRKRELSADGYRRSLSRRGILKDIVKPIVGKLVGDEQNGESSDNDNSSPDSEPPTPTASTVPAPNASNPPPPPPPPPRTTLPSPVDSPTSKPTTSQITTTTSTIQVVRPTNSLTQEQPPPVNNADFIHPIHYIGIRECYEHQRADDDEKGVQSPTTETPVTSVPTSVLSTRTTSSSYSYETAETDKVEDHPPHPHDNLHANTEKALIAVGSVGATIIVFFVVWLSWKCFKMRRGKQYSSKWIPGPLSFEKPKEIVIRWASRVPVLKDRLAKRTWSSLEKPYDNAYWEKQLPYTGSENENPNGITVHTAIIRESATGDSQGFTGLSRHGPNQSISSTRPQFNNTLRSNYQIPNGRMSEISSLSSGFGDGDIIMPPPNSTTTITATRLTVPAPAATRTSVSDTSQRRDTMYTEASEDPVPRFRNINSWVRQQTGRVKRAKQREMATDDAPPVPNMPPEQEFRLMMPDGEEPRRAQTAVTQGNEHERKGTS
ncbi:het domain-containing [Purpureocillium lavendulum]|uniref:Het domain-containing n=1 Tax=Purpureocillium lavendulum TaxID=1247861 RepID=A0AB34FLH8_9HYPO|nr:het domain-containing [Purpureocillium lavendulum]